MKNKLFAFLIMITACTTAPLTLTETEAQNTIQASVGQTLTIRLRGNATTGYSWKFSSTTPQFYKIIEETYTIDKHPQGIVGIGGYNIYKIAIRQAGTFTIKAQYIRPWEQFNPQTDKQLNFLIEAK